MKWFREERGDGGVPEPVIPPKPELYIPRDLADFVEVVRRVPDEVLTITQKKLIARVMSFEEKTVGEIMMPREKMVFVNDDEFLGPLTLDRLYKSGFQHFPVVDRDRHILGLLHTERLNNLKIREGMPAKKYVDKNVIYVRPDYLVTEAIAAMIRNDRDYLMVIDNFERLMGVITMPMCWKLMLGYIPEDDFKQDDSALAVAKRKFED